MVACYAGLTFCYSALAAVLPALSTDLFGFPHAGVNYGFLALGQSVGSLAFPFAANFFGLEAGRHWQPPGPALPASGPCGRWNRLLGADSGAWTGPADRIDRKMTNARRKADELTVRCK